MDVVYSLQDRTCEIYPVFPSRSNNAKLGKK